MTIGGRQRAATVRKFLLGVVCIWFGLVPTASGFDPTLVPVFADRVVVKKAERRLLLQKNGQVLAEYPINLGRSPRGHKQQAGDSRTPEGIYLLDYRKPDSAFHLALHVSYPNSNDLANARRRGVDAGGSIMVHGLPNWFRGADGDFPFRDWTDGCIALSNRHMQLVYDLVPDYTPIEILP
jgi:murein L,D-transpeptidase YafK